MRIGIGIGIPRFVRRLLSAGGDVIAPLLVSATVNAAGTSIVLSYSEALDPLSTPSAGAFALAGTATTVASVSITATDVTLTLAGTPIFEVETAVTLSYTPGGAPIQDAAGNDAAALVAQAVTNNSTVGAWQTSLLAHFDPGYGMTLDATMWPYSGATPVPTLSGNLASGESVYIRCRGDGDLNTALWNISFDGGKTLEIQGGITYVVIGAGGTYTSPLGLIVTFPAGSYTNTATYVSRVASWLDRTGTYTLLKDGAVACPITAGWGCMNGGFNRPARGLLGKKAISFNGDRYLLESVGLATATGGGAANAYHIFTPARCDVLPGSGTGTLIGMGRAASATPFIDAMGFTDSGATDYYSCSRRNDANQSWFGGGFIGGATILDTNVHIHEDSFDGTNSIHIIDGGQVGSTQTTALGNLTVDRFCVGGLMRNAISNRAFATQGDILVYSTNLGATAAAHNRAFLKAKYAITTPKQMAVVNEGASLSTTSRGDLSWNNAMLYGNDTVTATNLGSVGATLAVMTARAASADAAYNGALGAGHNLLNLWPEANDIGLTGTGDVAALKAAIVSYVSARKAAGFRVGLTTLLPHGQSAGVAPHANYLSKAADLNTWLRAGSSGADYIRDIAAVWPGGPDTRPDLYESDWIHLSVHGAHLANVLCFEPSHRQQSALAA